MGVGTAVVIPTLGRRASLDRVLGRLRAQSGVRDGFEVVLAGDVSADRAALERRFAASGLAGRVVQATVGGASAARNAGWRATGAPVVLFLDDDVLAVPGLVGAHERVHITQAEASVGVVGDVVWSPEIRVTPFMRWVDAGVQFDLGAAREHAETGWWHCYTANVSLKRAALEAVGGFDATGFPFGYEDLDLARRIHDAIGLRLRFEPAARGEHLREMTLDEWRATIRRIAPAERRFVARHRDVAPSFHDRFSDALARLPPMRGRGARVAGVVPERVPWLGPRLHDLARMYFERELALEFERAWAASEGEDPGPAPSPG